MTDKQAKKRLEHLRRRLRAENISYGELHELQSLAAHIEPGDVELLEPAGVPERINPVELWALCQRLHDWEIHMGGFDAPVWRDLDKALGVELPDEDEQA